GNFYWVANTGDEYGHNVRGISAADGTLNSAPGGIAGCTGCHTSLTLTDAETDGGRTNGCRGCHQSVLHHAPQQAEGTVPVAINGWYRFLNAPTAHDLVGGGPVHGIEDPNWEQTPDKDTHNVYYGGTGNDNEDPQSMGKYCSGCHYNFHADGDNTNESFFGVDNGGNTATEVWFRHPADAVIPNSSEYTSYVEYDPLVPVGRQEKADIATVAMDVVRPGTDKVICVSCHRAHGSAYPDMLRWDYTGMETGTTGSTAGTGCFKCHSTKDGV
ncbi:MAG: hypothetical protein KKE17_14250, partial [Proteobacteria bacterium]|nr:hypothetical protein [Pseudomonadota bacterium]MBU1711162.1 hypothetical protein [Pseudomonadota bacterium]